MKKLLAAIPFSAWLFFLLAVVLCFVPLFSLLGFEFSLAFVLPVAWVTLHRAIRQIHNQQQQISSSETAAIDAAPVVWHLRQVAQVIRYVLALQLIPIGVICLNALRVKNCNFTAGFTWWLLLPGAVSALMATLGVILALALPVGRVPRWATYLVGHTIIIALLALSAWRFYAAPPVSLYSALGYFPGALYDEDLLVPASFLWSRALDLSLSLAAVGLSAWLISARRLGWCGWQVARCKRQAIVCFLLFSVASTILFVRRGSLGFARSANNIARELGGRLDTDHFVIFYRKGGTVEKEIGRVAEDHEFRYWQLQRWFADDVSGKIHSYVFDTAADKQHWIGAERTSVAKPWRREIYLQGDAWPHPVLKHELAHVFAGSWGDRAFKVARAGFALNMGLVEGVAVAAAWNAETVSPHEVARVALDEHRLPPLSRLLSPAFLQYGAQVAYGAAGSFCRFLIERHGRAAFAALYAAGGTAGAYQKIYGQPLSVLQTEWHAFLLTVKLAPEAQTRAQQSVRAPSVFARTCAHERNRVLEQARILAKNGRWPASIERLSSLCGGAPDANLLADWMELAIAERQDVLAVRFAEELLARADLMTGERSRALTALGDVAWRAEKWDEAHRRYTALRALPLPEANARLIELKWIATQYARDPVAQALRKWLVLEPKDAAADLFWLMTLVDLSDRAPLVDYLVGRRLSTVKSAAPEAVAALRRSLGSAAKEGRWNLPDQRFILEAHRLLGRTLLVDHRRAEARTEFEWTIKNGTALAAEEERDFIERIEWQEMQARR